MYVIGIDLGTSATKTVLFNQKGEALASDSYEYPLSQPQNGWAEQNPYDWRAACLTTIKNVISLSGVDSKEIVSIGLSGQMHGLVMLDENNEVLRPAIIWCDQRTAKQCEDIERLIGLEKLIEITANPALTGFTASKIMWVKENEPDVYARCKHILLPKDYIRFILTGEYATEVSDASGMQLLDVPNRCWSQVVLDKLGIDISLLGKVYESPDVTGHVTEKAAQLTGLCVGTAVVGGAGDNAAAAVGTGVVRDGRAFTTIGTSGVVFAHTNNISIDPQGRVHTFCCAVPGAWHVMGVTQGAGLSLHWLRDNCCVDAIQKAGALNIDPYVVMDSLAAESPIGSNKLLFLPYLMGERTPHLDPDCRGVFFGLSAMHTQKDLIRCVMEGVAFSLNDCLGVLREMGVCTQSMLACGGGGSSALWRKILSDVFNCPISTVNSKEGAALGAAILAMVGAGMYESVEAACDSIIAPSKTMQPDNKNHNKYMAYYEVYKQIYNANKTLFKNLSALN